METWGKGMVSFNPNLPVFQKILLPKGRLSPLILKPLPLGLLFMYQDVYGSLN
jgi:hypothetical protein